MDKRKRFSTVTILVDNQMKTPDDGSAPILLYDGANECYYKTTIKHILMVALSESRDFNAKMEKRMDEFEKQMKKKQDKFMSDMVESNQSIINLAKELK